MESMFIFSNGFPWQSKKRSIVKLLCVSWALEKLVTGRQGIPRALQTEMMKMLYYLPNDSATTVYKN